MSGRWRRAPNAIKNSWHFIPEKHESSLCGRAKFDIGQLSHTNHDSSHNCDACMRHHVEMYPMQHSREVREKYEPKKEEQAA